MGLKAINNEEKFRNYGIIDYLTIPKLAFYPIKRIKSF